MRKIIKYKDCKVIGVTGGIGSGQSSVCEILAKQGCKIIDVDKKAKHRIKKDKTLQIKLKKAFGEEIFNSNGELNRHLLANIAFSDGSRTQLLNKLVHPRMVSEMIEEMETARFSKRYPLIVVDAALIYEISIEQMFDAIIVVYADLEHRIQRVIKRDNLTREEILARIQRQIPLEEKRDWADYEIDNNGSFEDMKKQTLKIFHELMETVRVEKGIRI
jgi:dephospho-CoA kinase